MFEPDKITRNGGPSNGSAQKDTPLREASKPLMLQGKMWVIASLATPIHGVRRHPAERYAGRKRPLDHRQRQPRLGGEGGSGRDMSARHAGRVAGPGLGQVEGAVDEGVPPVGHIGGKPPDLGK